MCVCVYGIFNILYCDLYISAQGGPVKVVKPSWVLEDIQTQPVSGPGAMQPRSQGENIFPAEQGGRTNSPCEVNTNAGPGSSFQRLGYRRHVREW